MVLTLAYAIVRFQADLVRLRSHARLRSEALALRHQLPVLERQSRTPRWQPADRRLLAALNRFLSRAGRSSRSPTARPCFAGNRELVRRKWAAYRRRPGRQRQRVPELRELVLQLAGENPRRGYRRIQGLWSRRVHLGGSALTPPCLPTTAACVDAAQPIDVGELEHQQKAVTGTSDHWGGIDRGADPSSFVRFLDPASTRPG